MNYYYSAHVNQEGATDSDLITDWDHMFWAANVLLAEATDEGAFHQATQVRPCAAATLQCRLGHGLLQSLDHLSAACCSMLANSALCCPWAAHILVYTLSCWPMLAR